MMLRRLWLLVCVAAASAFGSTIDISDLVEVTLHTGDELSFTVSDQNYKRNAGRFGAPAFATGVSFSLITASSTDQWSFTAELESKRTAAVFSNVAIDGARVTGAAYTGPATSIHGSLQLAEEDSRAIFAGPAATLVLRNTGGDVTLGLNPNTLPRNLQVTLYGDGLQVGAVVTGVSLTRSGTQPAPPGAAFQEKGALLDPRGPESVPEPSPASLLACAGVLLALSRFATRFRRGAAR
jgi:hypothetical protein